MGIQRHFTRATEEDENGIPVPVGGPDWAKTPGVKDTTSAPEAAEAEAVKTAERSRKRREMVRVQRDRAAQRGRAAMVGVRLERAHAQMTQDLANLDAAERKVTARPPPAARRPPHPHPPPPPPPRPTTPRTLSPPHRTPPQCKAAQAQLPPDSPMPAAGSRQQKVLERAFEGTVLKQAGAGEQFFAAQRFSGAHPVATRRPAADDRPMGEPVGRSMAPQMTARR